MSNEISKIRPERAVTHNEALGKAIEERIIERVRLPEVLRKMRARMARKRPCQERAKEASTKRHTWLFAGCTASVSRRRLGQRAAEELEVRVLAGAMAMAPAFG